MANSASALPRLTVAIPLFRAAPWYENILENIRRIPADALILLSDETHSDDTAQRVAEHFEEDPRIRLRLRNGRPGWREHCNALIRECETGCFSLLPQDDLITPGYYEKLVAALDSHPGAGLAFGPIIAEGRRHHQPSRFPSPPFALGSFEPWLEAIKLERRWNLGIPFRGVIRQAILRPISPTPGDQFADQVWVFGMALAAHLLEVPDAPYIKRFHPGNTHGRWRYPSLDEREVQLITEIRHVLGTHANAERAIRRLRRRNQRLRLIKRLGLGFF